MRVLAVGNMYPPQHLGGYELVWRSAMGYLRQQGHETRVLTTDFRLPGRAGTDDPGTFRELRWYWHEHGWPRLGWRARVALERWNAAVLARHLQELDPDVVSWWSMGGMSLSLIERVRRQGRPAAAFVHDDWLNYAPRVDAWLRSFLGRPRLAALAERLTGLPARVDLESGAQFVFVSETVRRQATEAGYRMAGSSIAHSGIDPSYLDPRPARPWAWRLLYVGRLDERKGVLDAVRALAELPAEATLTLVGDGDPALVAELRALADGLGIAGRITELGMRTPEELADLYAAADAVLFPVRWEEPWGLVPLEAMARGRAVIATGRGGSGEYLADEVNALLVPPADPAALARAVIRLHEDAGLRARVIEGGRRTAERHLAPAFNQTVLDVLEELAGHGRRLRD